MKSEIKFTDVFTKDTLNPIISTVEEIVTRAKSSEKDYNVRDFASNLYKLGLKLQIDDYKTRAEEYIAKIPPLFQADAYRLIGEYCLQKEIYKDQTKCFDFLLAAFNHWKEALKNRDPKKDFMSDYDYFHSDIRILEGLKTGKLYKELIEGKELLLEQIRTFSEKFQPDMLSQIAEVLCDVEEEEKIIEYLDMADKIITPFTEETDETLSMDMLESVPMMMGGQQMPLEMKPGSSILDLQLALAKEKKDVAALNFLLKATEKNSLMPQLSFFPQIMIIKAFHEIGEQLRATEILQDIIADLKSDFDNQLAKMPEMLFFTTAAAGQIVELCISLNEVDLGKQLVPILKIEDNQSERLPIQSFNRRTLLIKLGEYDKKDLLEEFVEIQKTLDKIGPLSPPTPDDFLPQGPRTNKPLFSLPSGYENIAKLSQLAQAAEQLEVSKLVEEIGEVLMKFGGKEGTPSMREKFLEQMKQNESIVLPKQIMDAYKANDIEKTDKLLFQLEQVVTDNINKLQDMQIPSQPGFPGMADKNIRRLLILTDYASILIEINKLEKVNDILEEIKEFYFEKKPLKGMSRGMQPGFPPLGLYRRYLTLKIKLGCNEDEIDTLFEYTKENDHTGLSYLGLLLLEAGNVDKAQEISDFLLKPKKLTFQEKISTWKSYYKRKSKILAKIGKKSESIEILEQIGKEPKEFGKFWSIERDRNLENLLLGGDLDRIKDEIETALANLSDLFVLSSLKPLVNPRPPQGVEEKSWIEARIFLGKKLQDIIESFESSLNVGLSLSAVDQILILLEEIGRNEEAAKFTLQILSSLQEAIEENAPVRIIDQLELIPLKKPTLSHNTFLEKVLNESNILFHTTRRDFWSYYRTTTDEIKLSYGQFDSICKKWYKEARMGNSNNFYLYISLSHIYSFLVNIFHRQKNKNLASMCYRNAEIFRKKRLKKVREEPNSRKFDSDWYLNLFDQIKNELKGIMQNYNYVTAKEYYKLALTLLEQEGVTKEDQASSFNTMLSYLADY